MQLLVQYGLDACLGRFDVEPNEVPPRFSQVLVRTARGLEAGTVLDVAETGRANLNSVPVSGHFDRVQSDADVATPIANRQLLNAMLDRAAELIAELDLPLLIIDGEILFDRSLAILQAIHHAECVADPLFAKLEAEFHIPVRLHDLTTQPAPASTGGCGKPGCGSEGGGGCSSCGTGEKGGCSTGSCSKGKVDSAADLTKYFAELRRGMEDSKNRVALV